MIEISPAARRDLRDIAEYFDRETFSAQLSDAFVNEFETVCIHLERFPKASPVFLVGRKGPIRRASLRRFSKYLVFYREIEGGILVQRVLHGMRHVPSVLGDS